MKEIYERKEVIGGIPVYRIGNTGKKRVHPVFLYHGWSSSALQQRTRGMILAWEGYEVWMPEAVHHGIRGTADYYAPASYDIFWKTIFQNIKEFPLLSAEARKRGLDSPWVMGHSMGGLTVLGMGAHFPQHIKGIISMNGSGSWTLTHLFLQARFGMAVSRSWPMYDQIEKEDPAAHIDAMENLPVLLLNGEADPSIDIRAQKSFYERLHASDTQSEMITYPGLGHFVTTNMMDDAVCWMNRQAEKDCGAGCGQQ